MARCRDILLAALLLGAGSVTSTPAAAMPQGAMPALPPGAAPAQYFAPERGYGSQPQYVPRRPPQRRQVCWTEQRRYHVGYDQWGRALYRTVPQRVCRWR